VFPNCEEAAVPQTAHVTITGAKQGAMKGDGSPNILERLWRSLPEERESLRPFVERAKAHRNDCGCAMGGVFLVGAVVLLIIDGVFFHVIGGRHWVTVALLGAGFAFGAGILGKLIGIGIARLRLGLVYRELRIRYNMQGG
jgi:hypothetical protein